MADNSGFGKDPLTPCHGDSLVDQSFQSLKSKEIRDSMSPTHDLKFHSTSLNHPNSTGWDVQTSSEISPDGRAYRNETVAKTDGVEKINGGTAEFKGRNEQQSSGSFQGDDKNFIKKASESSNTHLQEKVIIGDPNSGHTEMKMSSTTSSSSTHEASSSSTVEYGGDIRDNNYVLDNQNRYHNQQQQKQQQHNQLERLQQDQHRQQISEQNRRMSEQTQHRQQQITEEYNRNRHESSNISNVETQNMSEQTKRYIDVDKASPEYQKHVQLLMSQPGEIISNTVEYPKPNVKMITTVKRLPDGTIVKNKRYETEETTPANERTHQRTTTSTNQSNTQRKTEKRIQDEENVHKKHQNIRDTRPQHSPGSQRHPNVDVVDNVETVHVKQDRNINTDNQHLMKAHPSGQYPESVANTTSTYQTVKKSSQHFSTESTSETVEEYDDRSTPKGKSPGRTPQDFSTHGFPSVKPNKPTQEYPTERPHPARPSNDFSTHGFPSVKPNKPTQEYSSDRPQPMRSQDLQRAPERPDFSTQGFPSVRPTNTHNEEVVVVSSETYRTAKQNTSSQRVTETEIVTEGDYQIPDAHYPQKIKQAPHKSDNFSTHGFPSVKPNKPTQEYPTNRPQLIRSTELQKATAQHITESTKHSPNFDPHGSPLVKPNNSQNEEVVIISSETRRTAKNKSNAERIIETELITDGNYPSSPGSQYPETTRYTQSSHVTEDFSTEKHPTIKSISPRGDLPNEKKIVPDFSTHGFPSTKDIQKPTSPYNQSPINTNENVTIVSSETNRSANYKTSAERVVETEFTEETDYHKQTPHKPGDFSTHGFPSVREFSPEREISPRQSTPEYQHSPRKPHSSDSYSTNGFPSVRSPTKSVPDFSTQGFPSVKNISKPQVQPLQSTPPSKPQQRGPTTKKISTTETSTKVLQKQKEVDAAHRAFAASLRSTSPVDSNRSESYISHQRQTPRSSVSSTKTFSRGGREGSHDSEASRISTSTVTRQSPNKSVGKTVVTKQTIVKTKNVKGSNETIDLTPQRSTKSPSPGKTVTTSTTRTTTTRKTPIEVPKPEKSPYSPAPSTHKISTHPKNKPQNAKPDRFDEPTNEKSSPSDNESNDRYEQPIKSNNIGCPKNSDVERRTVVRETTFEKTNRTQKAPIEMEYEPNLSDTQPEYVEDSSDDEPFERKQTSYTSDVRDHNKAIRTPENISPKRDGYAPRPTPVNQVTDENIRTEELFHKPQQTKNSKYVIEEFIDTERVKQQPKEMPDGSLIIPSNKDSTSTYKKKETNERETFEDRCRYILGMDKDADTPTGPNFDYTLDDQETQNNAVLKNTKHTHDTKFEVTIEDCEDDEPLYVSNVNETIKVRKDKTSPIPKTRQQPHEDIFNKPTADLKSPRESVNSITTQKGHNIQKKTTTTVKNRLSSSPEPKPRKLIPQQSSPSETESIENEYDLKSQKENYVSKKVINCNENIVVEELIIPSSPQTKRVPHTSGRQSPQKELTPNQKSLDSTIRKRQSSPEVSPKREVPRVKKLVPETPHKSFVSKVKPTDKSPISSKPNNVTPRKSVTKTDDTNIDITETCKTKNFTSSTTKTTGKQSVTEKGNFHVTKSGQPSKEMPSKVIRKTSEISQKTIERIPRSKKPTNETPESKIKNKVRTTTSKSQSKVDNVDAKSSPESSPTRYTERRRSSNISVHTEIIIDHASPKSPKPTEPKPRKHVQTHSTTKDLIDSTATDKLYRKLAVTERKDSAPVQRVTRRDNDAKMARSTSENVIKVTGKTTKKEVSSLSPTTTTKPDRRPSKCFTTKTINLTTSDKLINSEDMENIIIDIQQAKSSREPSPDKIVPTPVPIDLDTGKPRYPDVVQEPEDVPRRRPVVKNIPIYEEESNDYIGCQISEVTIDKASKLHDDTDYQQHILDNPTIEAPKSLDYYPNGEPVDESLLSVHEKVTKFTHTAEEVKKPKASSPFNIEYDHTSNVAENDDCLLTVDQKVNKFIKTAESITKTPITSVTEVKRENYSDLDEDLCNDECILSVSQKVNKFINTAEKLGPTIPQKSPRLVAKIERNISRQSEPEYFDDVTTDEHLIPFSDNHTIELEIKRQKDILSRPSVWENENRKKHSHTNIRDTTKSIKKTTEISDDEELVPMSKTHTTSIELKRQKDILSRPSVFDQNKTPDNQRKPQASVNRKSKITEKAQLFENTNTGNTEKIHTTSSNRSIPSAEAKKRKDEPKIVDQRKGTTKYQSSTVTTTRSRFDSPTHERPAPKKQPQPSKRTRELIESDDKMLKTTEEYISTDTESDDEKTSSIIYKQPNRYTSPQEPSHSPISPSNKSTKATITKVTESTLKHTTPSKIKDTDKVEPLLEEPRSTKISPTSTHKSRITTETVSARRNIFEKDTAPTHKPTPSSSSGRRPSYMDHTMSSLEHTRKDSLEINKTNYSRKSSIEDDVQIERRPNTSVKFDVPQKFKKDSISYEEMEIEEIFDLEVLEKLLETVTSYELRRRIRAQIRLVKKNYLNSQLVDKKKTETKTSSTTSLKLKSSTFSSKEHHEETDTYSDVKHTQKQYTSSSSPSRSPNPKYDETAVVQEIKTSRAPLNRSQSPDVKTINSTRKEGRHITGPQTVVNKKYIHNEQIDSTTELRKSPQTERKTPKEIIYRPEYDGTPKLLTKPRQSYDRSPSPIHKTDEEESKRNKSPISKTKPQVYARSSSPDPEPRERSRSPKSKSKRQGDTYSVTSTTITTSKTCPRYERSSSPEYHSPSNRNRSPEAKKIPQQYVRNKSPDTLGPRAKVSTIEDEVYTTSKTTAKTSSKHSRQNDRSPSPTYHSSPTASNRSRSPDTKPQHNYERGANRDARRYSPESKSPGQHNRVHSVTKTTVTTKSESHSPDRKSSKIRTDEKTPIWADRKNVLKNQSTTTSNTRTSAAKVVKSTSQRQTKTNEEDSITSSYGIGPTDENGLPLFGIKALKKKKQTQPCEATEEVTGYVVEEKYYSDNKTKPVIERKEYIYSTNADELQQIKNKVQSRKTSKDDGVIRKYQKIDKGFEPKSIMPNSEEFSNSSKKFVRRGSVKEMSEKFIRKESSQSITEKASTYPKAGLILRTSNSRLGSVDSGDCYELSTEDYTKRTHDINDVESDGDYEVDLRRSSRTVVTEHAKESEAMNVQREVSKRSSSSSTRSFLNSSGESRVVSGMDDVLERMRNADNVVEEGDTPEDQEARALFNKFLGASVIMRGVETAVPTTQTKTTKSFSNRNGDNSKTQEFKTTRVTKTIKSENSSSPVIQTTCDIEEIWDEEILKALLEKATTYEERRKIRARLRELMAEREEQHATTTTEKTETQEKDGAIVTTTTKVTTRTVTGTGSKPVSPFTKFRQLDKQNSQQLPKSPSTPTTPGVGSVSPSGSAPLFKFTDPALNARAATVKDQLLQWCQLKTKEYENVQITNFSTSWSDGLAFCALIHHFLPDAFDYSQLTPQSRRHNFELAFTVADEKAGIAPLLDVEDMVVMKRPDWKCVFVYVQSIYRRFRNCQ